MKRRGSALLVSLAVALLSCGSMGTGPFSIAILSPVDTWDYYLADSDAEFLVAANCMEGLTEIDRWGRAVPALAEKWSRSADGVTWTFTLRAGLEWTLPDGSPSGLSVDAADFVAGIRYAADPRRGGKRYDPALALIAGLEAWRADLSRAESPRARSGRREELLAAFETRVGVKAKDARTVEFRLARPAPWFPAELASSPAFLPVDADWLARKGDSWAASPPPSCGPWLNAGAAADGSVRLLPNPRYRERGATSGEMLLTRVEDREEALKLFMSGRLDWIEIGAAARETLSGGPWEPFALPGRASADSLVFLLGYRSENAEFAAFAAHPRFREALSLAIDRRALAVAAGLPRPRIATGLVPAELLFDERGVDYTRYPPLRDLSPDQRDEARAREAFSAAAAELTDENGRIRGTGRAKVDWSPSAVFEIDGKLPVTLVFAHPADERGAAVAAALESMLERTLGKDAIDVVPAPVSGDLFVDAIATKRFDLCADRVSPRWPDPQSMLDLLAWDGSLGDGWPRDDAFDAMLDRARARTDLAERFELCARAESSALESRRLLPWTSAESWWEMGRIEPFTRPRASRGLARWRFKGAVRTPAPVDLAGWNEARERFEAATASR